MLETLKRQVDRRVRLTFSDGEALIGDLHFVLENEGAVVFDLVSSNRADKYEKSDKAPHIYADIADIASCEPTER